MEQFILAVQTTEPLPLDILQEQLQELLESMMLETDLPIINITLNPY